MLTNKCVVGKRVLIVALSTIMVGILFWLLMAAAYAIPSTQLTTKANQSRAILKQEGVLWMQNAALTSGLIMTITPPITCSTSQCNL